MIMMMMMMYDMMYLLAAVGLTPGSSSTAHTYTQTIHITHYETEYIKLHNLRN